MTNVRRPLQLQLSLDNNNRQQNNASIRSLTSTPASAPLTSTTSCTNSASSAPSRYDNNSTSLGDVEPSEILPHLFVGNREQTNKETVKRLNISYILSLGLLPLISSVGGQKASSTKITTIHNNQTSCNQKDTNFTDSDHLQTRNGTGLDTDDNLTNEEDEGEEEELEEEEYGEVEETIVEATKHKQLSASKNTATRTSESPMKKRTRTEIALHSRKPSEDFKIRIKFPDEAANTSGLTRHNNNSSNTTTTTNNSTFNSIVNSGADSDSKILAESSRQEPSQTSSDIIQIQQQQQVPSTSYRSGTKSRCRVIRTIRCKCINIADNSEAILTKFFDEAHQFIDEARRKKCNILVHCLAGISRSPTIAISYLMRCNSLRLQEAYNFVKQCRPQIDPNLSFMGQLMVYEKSLERLAGYRSSCGSSSSGVSRTSNPSNSNNNNTSSAMDVQNRASDSNNPMSVSSDLIQNSSS